MSSKGGYTSPSPTKVKKPTAEQKRQADLTQIRNSLINLNHTHAKLLHERDKILLELTKRDYDRIKTLTGSAKDEVLQQLKTSDYNKYQALDKMVLQTVKSIRSFEKKAAILEAKNDDPTTRKR